MSKLYVVATPIGNLSDISERALNTLRSVDMIAAEDTRTTLKLLNHFQIKTPLTSYHKFNEQSKSNTLIEKMLSADWNVAIVSDCGTPCISDPGYTFVALAIENSIEVISVPGPSAVIAALAKSGFDLNEFSFYGFLDRNTKIQKEQLKHIKSCSKIAVLYESPNRISKLIQHIHELDANCKLCVCRELTKLHETTYRGNPAEILAQFDMDINHMKGEYCIVAQWTVEDANRSEQISLGIEAHAFQFLMQGMEKDDIMTQLIRQGFKRNDIYKAILNVTQFIKAYSKRE